MCFCFSLNLKVCVIVVMAVKWVLFSKIQPSEPAFALQIVPVTSRKTSVEVVKKWCHRVYIQSHVNRTTFFLEKKYYFFLVLKV
jgi:hypothetical protein